MILSFYPYLSIANSGDAEGDRVRELGDEALQKYRDAVKELNSQGLGEWVILYEGVQDDFAGHEPHPQCDTANNDTWIHEWYDGYPSRETIEVSCSIPLPCDALICRFVSQFLVSNSSTTPNTMGIGRGHLVYIIFCGLWSPTCF